MTLPPQDLKQDSVFRSAVSHIQIKLRGYRDKCLTREQINYPHNESSKCKNTENKRDCDRHLAHSMPP